MELIPTPHRQAPRRRRPILVGVAVGLLLAVTGLVLVPLALGLHHVVIRDGAMGSSWRGALAIEEVKPGRDLGEKNVITFVPPGRTGDHRAVTRRVVFKGGSVARTRADGAPTDDPWELRLDESSYSRVIVRIPYVGLALTGYRPLILAALAAVLVTLAVTRRRRPHPFGSPDPGPAHLTDDETLGNRQVRDADVM